jgi:hypothetical protein
MATRTNLTYDDYAALPDDGKRYEVLAGALYVVPAPTWILDPEARHLQYLCAREGAWVVVAEGTNDDRVTDPAWPGLTIELASLWKPPPAITS